MTINQSDAPGGARFAPEHPVGLFAVETFLDRVPAQLSSQAQADVDGLADGLGAMGRLGVADRRPPAADAGEQVADVIAGVDPIAAARSAEIEDAISARR